MVLNSTWINSFYKLARPWSCLRRCFSMDKGILHLILLIMFGAEAQLNYLVVLFCLCVDTLVCVHLVFLQSCGSSAWCQKSSSFRVIQALCSGHAFWHAVCSCCRGQNRKGVRLWPFTLTSVQTRVNGQRHLLWKDNFLFYDTSQSTVNCFVRQVSWGHRVIQVSKHQTPFLWWGEGLSSCFLFCVYHVLFSLKKSMCRCSFFSFLFSTVVVVFALMATMCWDILQIR